MRLSSERVRESILHADPEVRSAAVHYFVAEFSRDPAVMPMAIQAIEIYGFADAFDYYHFLDDLVQTEETLRWLIARVRSLGSQPVEVAAREVRAYVSALIHADAVVLQAFEQEIMDLDALTPEDRDAIAEQMGMPTWPTQELWDELECFCAGYDGSATVPDKAAFDFAERLVAALASHGDAVAVEALSLLRSGDADGTWLEIYLVQLLGRLLHEAAIPVLTALVIEPDDYLLVDRDRALVRIGSEAVIRWLAETGSSADGNERMGAASMLEDIHSDSSVATCLDLFAREPDPTVRGRLLQSALMQFATEAIEPARQFILSRPPDPDMLEVRSALLTCCKIAGERFPEFDAWCADAEKDVEFRRQWYRDHPLLPDVDQIGEADESPADDVVEFEPEPPATTVVRRTERVGRNDPCPCGSGKKFKKCCYARYQAGAETDHGHATAMSLAVPPQATQKYPIGTVALYGPDDRTTTKIVAGVIKRQGAEPILERWVGTTVADDPKVKRQVQAFFDKHGVRAVAAADRNMGCPHEEGEDFPLSEDCPFCPFWAGKQGSARLD